MQETRLRYNIVYVEGEGWTVEVEQWFGFRRGYLYTDDPSRPNMNHLIAYHDMEDAVDLLHRMIWSSAFYIKEKKSRRKWFRSV